MAKGSFYTDGGVSYTTIPTPQEIADQALALLVGDVVTSFNSRQGAVVPASGDYTAAQVTNTPAGTVSATTVQAAINELDTDKASNDDLTAGLAGKANASHAHAIADVTNLQTSLDAKAPLASPALVGAPTAPTQSAGDNSTKIATTAYADDAASTAADAVDASLSAQIALKANTASPTLTGVPRAPTAAAANNSTQIATTAYVDAADDALTSAIALKADIASPTLTGTPRAPTAVAGTNDTQIATTAYVDSAVAGVGGSSYSDEQAQDAVGGILTDTTDIDFTYDDAGAQITAAVKAYTGDVTKSAGATSLTIANDAVTYAKMQNVSAASKLLGRGDSGAGDPQEITLGTNLSMSGTTLNATGGGGGGTPGGSDTQLQYNDGGAFGGASGLIYDDANNVFGVGTAGLTFDGFPVQFTDATNTDNNWLARFASYGGSGFSIVNLFTQTRHASDPDGQVAVINGDGLVEWRVLASDGTNFVECGTIKMDVDAGSSVSSGVVPSTFEVRTMDAAGLYQTRIFTSVNGQSQFLNFSSTNDVQRTVAAVHDGSGLAAGAGVGYDFKLTSPGSGRVSGAQIDAVMTNASTGLEDFDLRFNAMTDGALKEAVRFSSGGRTQFAYGGVSAAPIQIGGSDVVFEQISTNSPWGIAQITCGANAGVSGIIFAKSRHATPGSHTIVNNGDRIMDFQAMGSDGSDYGEGVKLQGHVDGSPTPGNGVVPGRFSIWTSDGTNFAAERLRIDNAGHVVLGGNASVESGSGVSPRLQVHGGSTSGDSRAALYRWQAAATSPSFAFNKSRSATVGSFSVVSSGDQLGQIQFRGDDGTTFAIGAQIAAEVDNTPGSGDMPGRLLFYTSPDGSASVTERMRIDSAGLVGIGVTPSAALHVRRGGSGTFTPVTDEVAIFQRNDATPANAVISLVSGTTGAAIIRLTDNANTEHYKITGDTSSNALIFGAGGSDRWRIDGATGNLIPASGATSFVQWSGQKRVTSDVAFTSTTTLGTVTGLSVNVAAGRTYTFEAELFVTDAAAGGVKAAIAGTATATAIQYTGYTIADNAIKGKTNATALATTVGSTLTTELSGIVVRISGTITVNAAGTLLVQAAQNTSNGTATTVKRGSYFIVHDMP